MKIVVACYGTRGDVEPCAAVARELLHRGHDVHMAVAPNLIAFVESTGLSATAFGPDSHKMLEAHWTFYRTFFRKPWRIREVSRLSREAWEPKAEAWQELSRTLTSLAKGADLLFTGLVFEEVAANVAEYFDIPLATLHYFPIRPNGELLSFLPAPLRRSTMLAHEWLIWRGAKEVVNAQRRELGLPDATLPSARQITERGSLEIQAYEKACFPGLADEWAKLDGQRPFVGALTMSLPTDTDREVASWIAAGTPPIFFGFGSVPVESAADTLAMITAACAKLGERALICAAGVDASQVAHPDDVKVVSATNFAAAFPACRAVVHHGGSGTTAAALRAGIPQLILSTDLDQTLWGSRVKRLKVGSKRRFSTTTSDSLLADLRTILTPQYDSRAREIATRMTSPAESVTAAADLVENFARLRSKC
ncbi:glycosyltransferase [Mycolicibacterium celeriflavum]|uniref:Glycosyltransferase n=1 Tax=Mycolicibacterium celeriflavum TaxID=1249101 RepID=A0A1X0BWB0_MYCCF|nr:glycosyltransferase [Mycolicibacterium celeriflavum]MCV7236498.1 glycosyltransferase [Mycolicibacterium celeriflavum]ORA47753.1 glycosyl transferase family 1 [Mycolicibacterium celeriflavum]BBY45807.1 glycosyltransferase [Mycolicibacterium celeriflavum]